MFNMSPFIILDIFKLDMFHREIFAKMLVMVSFWAVGFGWSLLLLDFYVFEIFIMSMYHFYYQKTIKLFLFWRKYSLHFYLCLTLCSAVSLIATGNWLSCFYSNALYFFCLPTSMIWTLPYRFIWYPQSNKFLKAKGSPRSENQMSRNTEEWRRDHSI